MLKKLLHFVWAMLGGNLPAEISAIESARKALMINFLCFGGTAILCIIGTVSLIYRDYMVVLIDLSVLIALLIIIVYLRVTLNTKNAGMILTVFLWCVFLLLIVLKGGHASFYIWTFPFPLIALFLIGIRSGTIFSVLLLAGACVVFYLGSIGLLPSPYTADQVARYIPAYSTILLMSIGMEKLGSDTQNRLKELNMQLEKSYDLMKQQAVTDALTGIPNRHSFIEYIDAEFTLSQSEYTPISILMCDIDYFKLYNDTYGHSAGDNALVKIASTISSSLPNIGDFCARYGGEEFIVVLPETASDGACAVAETIRRSIEQLSIPHAKSHVSPFVTISIGVATKGPDAYMSYEDLIRLADMVLYRAKGSGRNRVESVNMDD